jgi:putative ABC transport system permease protein
MNIAQLALAHVRDRKRSTRSILALLTFGLATIIALMLIAVQFDRYVSKSIKAIDLVIGAKGDSLQLLLSGVLQLGDPVGHLQAAEAESLRQNPLVAWSAPIGLADNFRGYRVVGTEQKFSFLYDAELVDGGNFWGTPFDAVLGAKVAKHTGLDVGDRFIAGHGLAKGGAVHSEPYFVSGILKPTGTVIDGLVLTSLQSLWSAHAATTPRPEMTALLIHTASPAKAAQLQTLINQRPGLQAIVPAAEAARLGASVHMRLRIGQGLALALILAGVLAIFLSLRASLSARRSDIAMLRVIGAAPRLALLQVVMEGLLLALAGAASGLLLGHLGLELAAWLSLPLRNIGITGFAFLPEEILLLLGTVVLGGLATLIPAWQAYRTDILDVLAER